MDGVEQRLQRLQRREKISASRLAKLLGGPWGRTEARAEVVASTEDSLSVNSSSFDEDDQVGEVARRVEIVVGAETDANVDQKELVEAQLVRTHLSAS